MPRNLKRCYGAGDLHFITCSCYRRQPLLGTARRRDLFLTVLEQVRRRYQFVVVGYVVMPEHFHLLIGEPQEETPSTVLQALKLGFARRVLARARRRRDPAQASLFDHAPQHIWQKRFYDFNVWTEHKRIEKLRYMHRNPVKRGLVASPEDRRPRKAEPTPVSAVRRPTSRKAREVGHPFFLLCQRISNARYTYPPEMGATRH
ncbi:MAG: transposase [Terriglobales bacterium]